MKKQVLGKMAILSFILAGCAIAALLGLSQPASAQTIPHLHDVLSMIRRSPMIATPPGLPDQRPRLSKEAKASLFYTFKVIDVPGAITTYASGINKSGKIVGSYFVGNGSQHGFVATAHGFTTVDFLGAINSGLSGINKAGHIVGGFVDNSGENSVLLNKALDQYWLTIFPDKLVTQAFGLNDSSQIVGRYFATRNDIESGILHAFLLDQGVFTTVDFPEAYWTEARGINNFGQIVGNYGRSPYGRDSHGFLLNVSNRKEGRISGNENFTPIDFPGAIATVVGGINDDGQIVGGYQAEDGNHGFLLSNGTFYTLDFPGASVSMLWDINQFGQIVGQFIDEKGIHGFYAEPKVRKQIKIEDVPLSARPAS